MMKLEYHYLQLLIRNGSRQELQWLLTSQKEDYFED